MMGIKGIPNWVWLLIIAVVIAGGMIYLYHNGYIFADEESA